MSEPDNPAVCEPGKRSSRLMTEKQTRDQKNKAAKLSKGKLLSSKQEYGYKGKRKDGTLPSPSGKWGRGLPTRGGGQLLEYKETIQQRLMLKTQKR